MYEYLNIHVCINASYASDHSLPKVIHIWMVKKLPGGCRNIYNTSLGNSSLMQILLKLICPKLIAQWPNHFGILHRAQQWYCCAMCNISKWFHDCYGQMKFHKISVQGEFQRDILYCNSSWYQESPEYGLSQWEKALHSNAFSHWPSPYQVWSLSMQWIFYILIVNGVTYR